MLKTTISTALKKLFFFDHGVRLLRPSAANWLLSMWFLAVAMATLEGFTWSKIMMVFLPQDYAVAAVCIGIIWGAAIWIADANFTTLDISQDYRKTKPPIETINHSVTGISGWLHNRLLMGSLIRTCIICISMALTGPFLAKTLDERTVLGMIDAENNAAIVKLRADAATEADTKINELEIKLADKREELVRETAGRSVSGRSGWGPVAKAMEKNINSLEAELQHARFAKTERLAQLARMSSEELVRLEGLKLLVDNAETRARMRAQKQQGKEEKIYGIPASEVLASALFMLLFMLMLVLKIYQPRSVAIYLNDHLQEMYERYLQGGFVYLQHGILPIADRHDGPTPMQAQRFDTWYHEVYLADIGAVTEAAAQQTQLGTLGSQVGRLEEGRAKSLQRYNAFNADLVIAKATYARLFDEQQCNVSEIETLEKQAMDIENTIKKARRAKLAERRTDIEALRQPLYDRKAVVKKELSETIPDALEEAVAAIQKAQRRLGIVLSDTTADDVAKQPVLAPLYMHRQTLLDKRHCLEVELLVLEPQLERLNAELLQITADLSHDASIADIGPTEIDTDADALRSGLPALREQIGKAIARHTMVVEQSGEVQHAIDRLRQQVAVEVVLSDQYLNDIRVKDDELSRASVPVAVLTAR